MKRISIDPVTRLEGHARIDLFLDQRGELDDCRVVIPELRGFEKFIEGRPAEELPRITSRICGICPEAHHAASTKAVEAAYGATIPPTAQLIRRLQYNAFVAGDHATHFYALGGPDFIVGPDATADERNLVGVIGKLGRAVASRFIRMRREAHEVNALLGGRQLQPVGMLPGGQARAVTEQMRTRLIEIGEFMVAFATDTQRLFSEIVLTNPLYLDLLRDECFGHRTHYASLVNEEDRVDHYDGLVRVVDPDGKQLCKFAPADYLQHVAERVEPHSYLKLTYLKDRGWNGFADGVTSGVYRVGPLGMLNGAVGMQTPRAHAEYERMFDVLAGKPVHATLSYHWARIIELMQCAELVLQHARDERLTDPSIREVPRHTPSEGVGIVEAPRGLLFHHYVTDERGILLRGNLIVGTANNAAPLQMSVRKAAQALVRAGTSIDRDLLNQIEIVFRAYDPCMACATHALPGKLPLRVRIFAPDHSLLRTIERGRGEIR